MEQDKDEEIKKNHGEVTTGVSQYLPPQMLTTKNIPENFNHDEKYIQYNIFENIFEVTAKYKSPIKFLGRGAYGVVCSAVNSKTNETVAIKKIMHAFDCNISARRTLREIMILRHFKHENIIGIKDIILPARRYDYQDVYIAYEFMDTDLYEVIRSKNELDKVHYELFLYQLLRGLKYIHSANVIHRDLKPSNLLVNAKCELKICDFGLARGSSDSMTEYVVTRWYRAPELLLNSCAYTAAIDVWAVGCIFMELINREPLFPGDGTSHQLRLIMELIGTPSEDELGSLNEYAKQYLAQAKPLPRQSFSERFPNVPPLAIDLMEKMLQFDPRRRISVEDALTHPYLTTMHDPNDEPECMTPLNNELEEHPLTVEQLREIIYCEALSFSSEQAITENEH